MVGSGGLGGRGGRRRDTPRRLVASSRAVNDASLDGLLYARHDARYCDAKGLSKATYNLPRESFLTDCPEWLDALWNEADTYEPTPKRMTAEDLYKMVEGNPDISTRALLRACLCNGLNKGTFDLLTLYRNEVRRARVEMPRRNRHRHRHRPMSKRHSGMSGLRPRPPRNHGRNDTMNTDTDTDTDTDTRPARPCLHPPPPLSGGGSETRTHPAVSGPPSLSATAARLALWNADTLSASLGLLPSVEVNPRALLRAAILDEAGR